MSAGLILLVEDEPRIAEVQIAYLQQAGMTVHHLARGDEVLDFVRATPPDVIVLDLMLPGMDGTSVCRELRRTPQHAAIPVIMVTAKVEEIDRLLGFEVGADDYVCKPFSPRELVARVKAHLRRNAAPVAATPPCPLLIDAQQQRATWNGKLLNLTPQQFRLLQVLAGSPGRIYSRSLLLELAYPDGTDVIDRAIDSQIKNLRKKLALDIPELELIHSVYGVGYRLEFGTAS
ncbi:MAG: response regulator [Pseudomonadota bacterium]